MSTKIKSKAFFQNDLLTAKLFFYTFVLLVLHFKVPFNVVNLNVY